MLISNFSLHFNFKIYIKLFFCMQPKNKSNDADMGNASKSSSNVPDLNVPEFIPKRKTGKHEFCHALTANKYY